MDLDDFIQEAIKDRLEGWELVDFLQVPIQDILSCAIDNEWITDDNLPELLEYVGINDG